MEPYIQKSDFQSLLESAEIPSTLEARRQTSSESQTLRQAMQVTNTELAQAEPEAWFEQIQVGDLDEEDIEALDRARKATFYVYTVQEFAEALRKGTYDIFKL